jgi:hypothetical protein
VQKTHKQRPARKARVRIAPGPATLHELMGTLLMRPNISGCFLGTKHTAGRATNRIALVCCVTNKLKTKDLSPEEIIPPLIPWVDPIGNVRELATDVRTSDGKVQPHDSAVPIAGPGDVVVRSDGVSATVGMAIHHPQYGRVVTTAAHLFPGVQPPVPVDLYSGGVTYAAVAVEIVKTQDADYALIKPNAPIVVDNKYLDRHGIAGIYDPSPTRDVGTALAILKATAPKAVRCRGLFAALQLSSGRPLRHAIITDLKTLPGDSGAALVDDDANAWGLLVGRFDADNRSYSVFLPASVPLFRENANFIFGRT